MIHPSAPTPIREKIPYKGVFTAIVLFVSCTLVTKNVHSTTRLVDYLARVTFSRRLAKFSVKDQLIGRKPYHCVKRIPFRCLHQLE